MTAMDEKALTFPCGGETLIGVLSEPAAATARGVLVIVGGPQYRAGSHRQFVLLARHLAANGIPVMRFDYRGMGDSTGGVRRFEEVHEDIACAIGAFFRGHPALEEVVLWGLCDGASAALFYAHSDPRVAGLVLVNPWVRTEAGSARTNLLHYYSRRVFQRGFWAKLFRGELKARQAGAELAVAVARGSRGLEASARAAFPQRMLEGLLAFKGPLLVVLSGDDLTAKEFKLLATASAPWRDALAAPRIARRELIEANHTFSTHAWRNTLAAWTEEWVKSL